MDKRNNELRVNSGHPISRADTRSQGKGHLEANPEQVFLCSVQLSVALGTVWLTEPTLSCKACKVYGLPSTGTAIVDNRKARTIGSAFQGYWAKAANPAGAAEVRIAGPASRSGTCSPARPPSLPRAESSSHPTRLCPPAHLLPTSSTHAHLTRLVL